MSRTPKEQLVSFLSDMYSVEQQALAQMVTAPKMAGDPTLAADFAKLHRKDTIAEYNRRLHELHEAASAHA
jgi:ferritin-like metal-binding protein YciE